MQSFWRGWLSGGGVSPPLSRSNRVAPSLGSMHMSDHLSEVRSSHQNHQLPTYFSRDQDPSAVGRDAMQESWEGIFGYAFPPIAMILRVLLEVANSLNCLLFLAAPLWPKHWWFSHLLDLFVGEPVSHLCHVDLLTVPPRH